jgi:hypothetical protein
VYIPYAIRVSRTLPGPFRVQESASTGQWPSPCIPYRLHLLPLDRDTEVRSLLLNALGLVEGLEVVVGGPLGRHCFATRDSRRSFPVANGQGMILWRL